MVRKTGKWLQISKFYHVDLCRIWLVRRFWIVIRLFVWSCVCSFVSQTEGSVCSTSYVLWNIRIPRLIACNWTFEVFLIIHVNKSFYVYCLLSYSVQAWFLYCNCELIRRWCSIYCSPPCILPPTTLIVKRTSRCW